MEGRGKVAQLAGLRVALVAAFFVMGGLGALSMPVLYLPGALLVMAGATGLLVYGVMQGNDGDVLAGWAVQVGLWWGSFTLLDPEPNVLGLLALTSASIVLLDSVHMVGLAYPMSQWRETMTAEQTEAVWGLLSSHIVRVIALGAATFLSSVVLLALAFQLTPRPSSLLGSPLFAAVAIVVAFLVVTISRGRSEPAPPPSSRS